MKVKDLKRLLEKLESEGYGDSDIRVLKDGFYCITELSLVPDVYGDVTLLEEQDDER